MKNGRGIEVLAALSETGPRFSTAVRLFCSELLQQPDVPLDAVMEELRNLEEGIRGLPVDFRTQPYARFSATSLQWLQAMYAGAPSQSSLRDELVRTWDSYAEIEANVVDNLARKPALPTAESVSYGVGC